MPGTAITRRRLLTTAVNVTAALALGSEFAGAGPVAPEPTDVVTLYDPRFPRSRPLARVLSATSRLYAIGGDASPLLAQIAQIASGVSRGRRLRLQGVTTESIPFCLEQFAGRRHDLRLEARRVDRDLFTWTLSLGVRPPVA
jgi:hypothetical protein